MMKGPKMNNTASSTNHRTPQPRIAHPTLTVVAILLCAIACSTPIAPGRDNRAPDVPAALSAGYTNKVSFHGYAAGFQIYVATPSATSPTGFSWTFKAPEAILYDNDSTVVAIHYAGPTWESNSGCKVIGTRVSGVTVDTNAIPWLLLRATASQGPGIFEHTTYIQRVNTSGGLAPSAAPTNSNQEARVPYTADYYFYRDAQH